MSAYRIEQVCQRLQVSVWCLEHARLALLRYLDEERAREVRANQGVSQSTIRLQHVIAGIQSRAAGCRCHRFDPQRLAACHRRNLRVGQAGKGLNPRHLPYDLAENDDVRHLAVVELVNDISEDGGEVGTIATVEHARERRET